MEEQKIIYAVNGSPRRNGNTATLLQNALDGAASQGCRTRMIHLADLKFTGCRSCFACKRKGGDSYGKCALQDDLTEVLAGVRQADGLILGTPIYFGGESSLFRCFMERLFFPLFRYDHARSTLLGRSVPLACIYTMNVPEEMAAQHRYAERLKMVQAFGGHVLQSPDVPVLYAYNTWQFEDYSLYDAEMFDLEDKRRSRETEFPGYCREACAIGEKLARK